MEFAWQKKVGNMIAFSGTNRIVNISDRNGQPIDSFELPGLCVGMDWSSDGSVLAVINDKSADVILWDSSSRKAASLDTSMRAQPTFIAWSKLGLVLAVGTAKGGVLVYNHQNARKTPFLGKHVKKITCGVWSEENHLILGSEDHSVSINNSEGDVIQQPVLGGDPSNIQVFESSSGPRVSIVVDNKTLYLVSINDPDTPLELAFQSKYGNIVSYRWFGDARLLMGFASGYLVVVSTNMTHIGQELYQARNHKTRLSDVTSCVALNKAATCGDNYIKIHDLSELSDTFTIPLDDEKGMLDKLAWTDDGQLLTISTATGVLHTFLSRLPQLGSASNMRVLCLSALQEMALGSIADPNIARTRARLPVEPVAVGVGPYHAACALNNSVWFYTIDDNGSMMMLPGQPRSCIGSVRSLHLSADYCAALCDGRLHLQMIENEHGDGSRDSRLFPEKAKEEKITCAALRGGLCIYGTETGGLHYFFIDDWAYVNEFRHVAGIRFICPDANGTRLLFVDEKGDGYLYNPVNDGVLEIPNMPLGAKGMLWDEKPADQPVFVVFDGEEAHTYVYLINHIRGPKCVHVNSTKLPYGQMPLALYDGNLSCLTAGGKTEELELESHKVDRSNNTKTVAARVAIGRYQDALRFCAELPDAAKLLSPHVTTVLESLDIRSSIAFYRAVGSAHMVDALQKIEGIEDRYLLGGHVALLLKDVQLAQDLFLKSTCPQEALNMYRDLLQWEQALKLAQRLAPAEIPAISREYAQQLELTGNYQQALQLFEAALAGKQMDRAHTEACRAGLARMLAQSGDIKRALKICDEMNQKALHRDVAAILERQGHTNDAATLFERAELYDRAAAVYIRAKNWNKTGEVLKHVTNAKLHLQYAKAREADGSYREAVQAYENAKDYLSVVRIHLDHLRNPDPAVKIVKARGLVEGAKMVAKFFQNLGDFVSAIQFLVMSKCSREAFALAQQHNQMEIYADVIGDDATPEDLIAIAQHFEKTGDILQAGRFWMRAGDYNKAVKLLLKCNSEDGSHIDLAIEAVSAAHQDNLQQQLINYIMGESDGQPKPMSYLFKLYLAQKDYRQAADTAVVIAREDQIAGNYRTARDTLLSMYSQLRNESIKIPAEMSQNLMLLHSYLIVKIHIKRNDHLKGARMLLRVASNISRFPAHTVQLLTSTVIECHRSGLKNSAFSYAAVLMRPEYRQKLDPKYKKKIEQIVRKPETAESPEEEISCPYCKTPVKATTLHCTSCDNLLPYCIATGQHMVHDDWSECPHCHFPAIYKEFAALLETEENCPMCSKAVTAAQIVRIQDCSFRLRENKEQVEKGIIATDAMPVTDMNALASYAGGGGEDELL